MPRGTCRQNVRALFRGDCLANVLVGASRAPDGPGSPTTQRACPDSSIEPRSPAPMSSSTTAAFRLKPTSFARFMGDFRNAALNCA